MNTNLDKYLDKDSAQNIDWTHKRVRIKDIRKIKDFYILSIPNEDSEFIGNSPNFIGPLMVKDHIFESRLRSYFLKEPYNISRDEILSVFWNMFITKGYYVKATSNSLEKFHNSPDKYYVSYLEIDGDLGEFNVILKSPE